MKSLQQLLDLNGKTAVVTGAGKGIGEGIALRLAEAGAHVVVADIDTVSAQGVVDKIESMGLSARPITVDVSIEAEVIELVQFAKAEFGSLDILVNNAGIYPPVPIADLTDELFDKVMRVNLRSVFLTTKHASEVMKAAGGGRIINITSIDALHPSMIGLSHYDASKHGMWGFTKNSALELASYNILVNAVAPGGIATPGVAAMSQGASKEQMEASTKAFMAKIPLHRMGEADEIGTAVLFLASDMATYMTGSQIVVDGGALLS